MSVAFGSPLNDRMSKLADALDWDVAIDAYGTHLSVPDVAATGANGALKRAPRIDAQSVPLFGPPRFVPSWKPFWAKLKTAGLKFPEGIELAPVTAPREEQQAVRPIAPAKPPAGNGEPARKSTRVRPPADALSLEDRLFYLLQPPLESWLRGQELIMPFEPFPYQYEGIAWLFAQKAALLADEMGLGKTMQTITALRLLLRAGQVRRVLLVCPKPLIPNWQREFKMWAEELPVTTVDGDGPRRRLLWQIPGAQVLLANYELVVRDFQEMLKEESALSGQGSGKDLNIDGLGRVLRRVKTPASETGRSTLNDQPPPFLETQASPQSPVASPLSPAPSSLPRFDLVVLDEAQRIKNRDSLTSTVVRGIPRKRSLCLTGTPIENRPEEMASLFEFMGVIPPRSAPDIRQLTRLSQEYVLRRTKNLVMTDLPPRFDRDEIIELSPAQKLAYEQAEKDGVIQLNDMGESITVQHIFELVLRLKQITNFDPLTGESSKLDRLQADMEEIAACGGKAILFSQWTKTIDWLAARLTDVNPLIYHGGIPTAKREPILKRFKEDDKAHLLLMSYGTGAVGLNLQFAGYVFLYDRWWNPAVEDQAINRAHRIGQKTQVIVSKFICKDTIEEKIDKVLKEKRDLFARVLGEGDSTNESLSMNASEIFGLFDLKARTKKGGSKSIGPKPATGQEAA
ncbi:MAG: DEAD/DEAH box helicase [Planctomycetaceae bacterium]|nr:DEAD/DEAH box helicase [Planctomycetaceae bacterium]